MEYECEEIEIKINLVGEDRHLDPTVFGEMCRRMQDVLVRLECDSSEQVEWHVEIAIDAIEKIKLQELRKKMTTSLISLSQLADDVDFSSPEEIATLARFMCNWLPVVTKTTSDENVITKNVKHPPMPILSLRGFTVPSSSEYATSELQVMYRKFIIFNPN